MSRPISPATELRNLRRDMKILRNQLSDALQRCSEYRGRLTKAETETADWRRRFDLLLARTPGVTQ